MRPRPPALKVISFGPDNGGIGWNWRSLIVECSPIVENYPPPTVIVIVWLEGKVGGAPRPPHIKRTNFGQDNGGIR
jgi:hypothetical protein